MSTREIQSFLSQHYTSSTSSSSTSLEDGQYNAEEEEVPEEADCVGMGYGKDLSFSVVLPTLHRLRMISYMRYTIIRCIDDVYNMRL